MERLIKPFAFQCNQNKWYRILKCINRESVFIYSGWNVKKDCRTKSKTSEKSDPGWVGEREACGRAIESCESCDHVGRVGVRLGGTSPWILMAVGCYQSSREAVFGELRMLQLLDSESFAIILTWQGGRLFTAESENIDTKSIKSKKTTDLIKNTQFPKADCGVRGTALQ